MSERLQTLRELAAKAENSRLASKYDDEAAKNVSAYLVACDPRFIIPLLDAVEKAKEVAKAEEFLSANPGASQSVFEKYRTAIKQLRAALNNLEEKENV